MGKKQTYKYVITKPPRTTSHYRREQQNNKKKKTKNKTYKYVITKVLGTTLHYRREQQNNLNPIVIKYLWIHRYKMKKEKNSFFSFFLLCRRIHTKYLKKTTQKQDI